MHTHTQTKKTIIHIPFNETERQFIHTQTHETLWKEKKIREKMYSYDKKKTKNKTEFLILFGDIFFIYHLYFTNYH